MSPHYLPWFKSRSLSELSSKRCGQSLEVHAYQAQVFLTKNSGWTPPLWQQILKPVCQSDTTNEFQESLWSSVLWSPRSWSASAGLSGWLYGRVSSQISGNYLPLTAERQRHNEWVSRLPQTSKSNHQSQNIIYGFWRERNKCFFFFFNLPRLTGRLSPDFKYNCTCKYRHPPTIMISGYQLQNGKNKQFWFVFYTMITYWMVLLTRNSACQMNSRYS